MTPAQDPDYDSNSLKRRNPRQMFTDSAFYSPKFHPSVAEQVEMAHKLSSSLFNEGNKLSKGQEMYMKRAQKSGETMEIEPEVPRHDKTPNLKLVMNPEGKLHDWTDLPEEEVPEKIQIAMVGNPEIAKTLSTGLNDCKGRGGELFAKRRKKADKWVVDENQIGLGQDPSGFADEFVAQQTIAQQQLQEEKNFEIRAQQLIKDEADAKQTAEKQEIQIQQQQIFQEQQMMKQQQSQQIKQQQQIRKQSVDLPPNFQHCSLKGRPFTPSLDLSIHNVQGIDVWAPKGPKPFGKAGTYSRTTPFSAQGSQQPAPASVPQQDKPQPIQENQGIPQLEVVPPTPATAADEPDYEMMKAQMERHQTIEQTKQEKVTQVTESISQQEVLQQQQMMLMEQQQQQLLEQQKQHQQLQQQQQQMLEQQKQQQLLEQQKQQQLHEQQQMLEQQKQQQMLEQQKQQLLEQQKQQQLLEQQKQEALAQAQHEQALAEKKKKEYEEWMRAQELEAYRLEYDCSVKYEEHQSEQEKNQQTQLQTSELTTSYKNEQQQRIEQQQMQRIAQPEPVKMPEQPKPFEKPAPKPVEAPRVVEQPKPIVQAAPKPSFPSNQSSQISSQRDVTDFTHQSTQQFSQESFQQQSFSSQQKVEAFSSATHQTELSMQMKSGGILREEQERQGPTVQINDYVGSLKATTTGEMIRQPPPDAIYTSNRESVYNEEQQLFGQANLKRTQQQGKDPRQAGGVFVGIAGDKNSLMMGEAADYERHTVRNLVEHFSKTKTGDIPPQFLPQQYMQNSGEAPPLSYLKEREATVSSTQVNESSSMSQTTTKTTKVKETLATEDAEERLKLFQRRGSLKDYLMMDCEDGQKQQQQSSNQQQSSILDPSAILQVDGSIEPGLGKKRAMRDSTGREDSQGAPVDTDKWDNHNTIARGWLSAGEDHYQPVTFRKLYGTKSVMGPSPLPIATSSSYAGDQEAFSNPPAEQEIAPEAQEEVSTPQDEGYADL